MICFSVGNLAWGVAIVRRGDPSLGHLLLLEYLNSMLMELQRVSWGQRKLEECFEIAKVRCYLCSQRAWEFHSNEEEVLAILEELKLFSRNYGGALILASDSSNAIAWVSNRKAITWKFQFYFNEIRELSASINVSFHHEVRSTNSLVDGLTKQGVERLSPWVGVIM